MRLIVISVIAVASALGCSSQEAAQQRLIERLDHGLTVVQESSDGRQQLLESLYAQRRRQLDTAFDADVRLTESLEPDWVIEARRAYTAALEAMWRQEAASQESHSCARANLLAIREGLERLKWMSQMRQNWNEAFAVEENNHE